MRKGRLEVKQGLEVGIILPIQKRSGDRCNLAEEREMEERDHDVFSSGDSENPVVTGVDSANPFCSPASWRRSEEDDAPCKLSDALNLDDKYIDPKIKFKKIGPESRFRHPEYRPPPLYSLETWRMANLLQVIRW